MKVGFGAAIVSGVVVTRDGRRGHHPGEQARERVQQHNGVHNVHKGNGNLKSANSWATAANVAFAVGSVGAVVGLVGLWRSRSTTATVAGTSLSPWIGLGAAGLDGRF